ncbi:transcription termination/antitermination protein NusG [Kaistia sp. MMO-174]|uniref:transcription termination/antitermination protein NusG n=1 Tax=Kaistia sp. MMO-174 TaxID=3081256 RepID=UPI0030160685
MKDWYVVRLAPGATRDAKSRPCRPARPDETAFEQEMQEEGFACYLPKLRREIIHHRTKKKYTRAFPLFTGYAFVQIASDDRWPALRDCDAVGSVLSLNGRPWAVSSDLVTDLRAAEANMIFDDTREARIKRRQEGRTHRETTAMRFPAGLKVQALRGPFAGYHGMVENVTGRGLVRVMMQLFGGEAPVEVPVDWLDAAE